MYTSLFPIYFYCLSLKVSCHALRAKRREPTAHKFIGNYKGQKLGGKSLYDFLENEPHVAAEVVDRNEALGARCTLHFTYKRHVTCLILTDEIAASVDTDLSEEDCDVAKLAASAFSDDDGSSCEKQKKSRKQRTLKKQQSDDVKAAQLAAAAMDDSSDDEASATASASKRTGNVYEDLLHSLFRDSHIFSSSPGRCAVGADGTDGDDGGDDGGAEDSDDDGAGAGDSDDVNGAGDGDSADGYGVEEDDDPDVAAAVAAAAAMDGDSDISPAEFTDKEVSV